MKKAVAWVKNGVFNYLIIGSDAVDKFIDVLVSRGVDRQDIGIRQAIVNEDGNTYLDSLNGPQITCIEALEASVASTSHQ